MDKESNALNISPPEVLLH